MKALRIKKGYWLLCSLAALALAGCGTSSGTDYYYKINYYSDYSGIDYTSYVSEDSAKSQGAFLLGHDYVLKTGTGSERATTFHDDSIYDPTGSGTAKAYDSVSLQTPTSAGHHFEFKGWKGYYSGASSASSASTSEAVVSSEAASSAAASGSSVDEPNQGDPVSMDFIRADCALYAYFEEVPNTFTIRLRNWDNSILNVPSAEGSSTLLSCVISGKYGVALDETNQAILDRLKVLYPDDKGPDHNLGNDSYHQTYAFLHWANTEEGSTETYTTSDLFAKLTNGGFGKNLDFKAVYDDPAESSFTVKYLVDGVEQTASQESVVYNQPITIADPTTSLTPDVGKVYSFSKWAGTYASTASDPLPSAIAEGTTVDPAHIRYNCTLTAVFVQSVIQYTVTFHYTDSSGAAKTQDVMVDYGGSASYTPASLQSGKSFYEWDDADGHLLDLTSIKANLDAYAKTVDTTITSTSAVDGDFTYDYSEKLRGYILSSFTAGTSTRLDAAAFAASISDASLIKGFADSLFKDKSTLTAVYIPASVVQVGVSCFLGCSNVVIYSALAADSSAFSVGWNPSLYPTVYGVTAMGTSGDFDYAVNSSGATLTKYVGTATTCSLPDAIAEENVVALLTSCFAKAASLTAITLSSATHLTTIGAKAFDSCTGLTVLAIPASVTYVGAYAVYGCTGITSLTSGVSESVAAASYDAKWNYRTASFAITVVYS